MDETENLPSKLAAHSLASAAGKPSNLVARGMFAVLANKQQVLTKRNDARYRQAREVYDRLTDGGYSWRDGHLKSDASLIEALETLLQLSDEGYGEAHFPLSTLFRRGGGDQQERAAQMVQRSSDQGYGPAQYCIAGDMDDIFDVTDEQRRELYRAAFNWYREHFEFGNSELRYYYASMHFDGLAKHFFSEWPDRSEGVLLLEAIASEPILVDAKTGRPFADNVQGRASWTLGWEMLKFSPSPEKIAEAIHRWEQAVDLGNASACAGLVILYLWGRPLFGETKNLIAIDLQQADYWFDRAIQLGNGKSWAAADQLAHTLLEGEQLPEELALAEKWLQQAANAGSGFAQMLLGVEYESGKRFPKNIALAKYWYKNPAEEGRWLAAHNLACLLEIDSSFEQALSLYKKAAHGGYKPSQQRLDELSINWKTT